MIKLSMCNKGQISIVRALLLFFLWTILVIDPNINVDISVNVLLIKELDFEA